MIAQLDKVYLKVAKHRVFARLMSYLFYEGRPLTTKGRWINFLVFLNFQIFSRIPAPRKVVKPIFILGVGRSGSTILGKIFSIHNQVGFLNEPKAFWYFLNAKDDIIGSYNKKGNGRYYFNKKDATKSIIRKANNIYGWYLFFTGTRRVVDKYPEHIFRIEYLRAIFPDAKFILLIRDVRNNSESIANWSTQKGIIKGDEIHDWWGKNDQKWKLLINQVGNNNKILNDRKDELLSLENHKVRGEVEWFLTMEEILKYSNQNDTVRIQYETLVNTKTIKQLLNYLELEENTIIEEYIEKVIYKNAQTKAKLSDFMRADLVKILKIFGYVV